MADERKRLLDEIRDEAKRRQIPTADLNAAWPTYLGTATKDNADPAALTDLLSWVRTRGPQSPPPPGRAT